MNETKEDLVSVLHQLSTTYNQLLQRIGTEHPELQLTAPPRVKKPKSEPAAKTRVLAPHLVPEFIEWFIRTPEEGLYNVKRGQWECKLGDAVSGTAHTLVFHSKVTKNRVNAADVICIRPPGAKLAIFNASRIAYGTAWAAQKEPQAIAERCGAVPIPFQNVVAKEAAGLDLSKLQIVEWNGSEKLIIPPVEKQRWRNVDFHVIERHFAGAVVVRVEDKYFLFDADREELEWCGFNPFFTQLPHAVGSIKEAYEALMPEEVKAAIAAGQQVLRQGELFFVPVPDKEIRSRFDADTQSGFFYDQLGERIQHSAALTYNVWRHKQAEQVAQFLKLCKANNGGKLPESKVDAKPATEKLVKQLAREVGTAETHVDVEKLKKAEADMSGNYWRRNEHVIDYGITIHEEVQSRLRKTNLTTGKAEKGRLPFMFNARIGETTGGTQQHSPTVMYCPDGTRDVANPVIYARGTVYHLGREHRPVYLEGWHRVYPNTAVHNWTVSGDVD